MSDAAPTPSVDPKGLSRRTIVKGAAWTVPALALAVPVPAYAASPPPCTPTTSFDNLTPGTSPSSITFYPSLVTASLGYTSSGQGGDNTPGDTGQVAATDTVPSWNYIAIEMVSPLNTGDYVELTITLSQAVTGLSFILHDLDQTPQGWRDTIYVLTAGNTYALGGNLQGAGTSDKPFRPINNGDTPIGSGLGDVRLTWPGSVNSVKFRYIAGINGNSQNQHIGLGTSAMTHAYPTTRRDKTARTLPTGRQHVQVSAVEPTFIESDGTVDS